MWKEQASRHPRVRYTAKKSGLKEEQTIQRFKRSGRHHVDVKQRKRSRIKAAEGFGRLCRQKQLSARALWPLTQY